MARPVISKITTDSGQFANDFVTNDQTLVFEGTANNNQLLEIYINGDLVGTTTASPTGTWTFDYTATILGAGTYNIQAVGGGLSDPLNVSVDLSAPSEAVATVAFSADTGTSSSDFITTTAAQTITGTLTANLAIGDVVKISLDNGATWQTASATVGTNTFSLGGVMLAGGDTLIARVEDTAGNFSAALSQAYVLDQSAPSVTVNIVDGALNDNDSSSEVTFAFSEAPNGTFTSGDISFSGGTLGALVQDDPTHFHATFTADDDAETTGSVTVGVASYTDTAGNSGAGHSDTVAIDTRNPSVVSVLLSDDALKIGDTSNVTITFSEAVTGFDNSDVTVDHGTLSPLSSNDGGITWTGTFTPDGNVEDATNQISVAATYTDAAGNAGVAGASGNYAIDTKAPTVIVNIEDGALNDADPSSNVTFAFSEAPGASFVNGDISVIGGTLGALVQDDATHYHATFTADDNIDTTGSVTVNGASYLDAAGNAGASGADTVAIDRTADAAPAVALVVGPTTSADEYVVDITHLVAFTVTGLDADATGVVTFTDGTHFQTVNVNSGQTSYSADLSALTGGLITSSLAVTDDAGNSAGATGNAVYSTIQSAIDAADAGDTIGVAAGTYAGATISKAVTLLGAGAGSTIIDTSYATNGLQLAGNIDATVMSGSATVTIDGIGFLHNQVGVNVSSTTVLHQLTVQNADFKHSKTNGVGMGSGAPALANITIQDSTFTQNGDGTFNGDGDVSLFGFLGNALLRDLTIHGGDNATPTNANADTAIQINGRDPATYDVTQPIGNVTFDNVDVTGSYAKVMVYVQGYTDLDGLNFDDSGNGGTTINGHAGWGYALYINPTADESPSGTPGTPGQPGFFDAAASAALAPNNVDLTHVTVSNDVPVVVPSGHPLFAFNGQALATIVNGTPSSDNLAVGDPGSELFAGGGGIDSISGYGAGYHLAIAGGHWIATDGTHTDDLAGVEKVVIDGDLYLLVDKFGANIGGFQSVQAAINAAPASGGAVILIAPDTYTESAVPTEASGTMGGLYINKPDLTLQGVKADGSLITTAADAQAFGATIISGSQADFGSNHFVGAAAANTTIQGLHLQAGPATNNKLLEIWAENSTVQNNFIDVNVGGTAYSFAAAIYFNDNGTTASDAITKYTVDHNILNEGIIVSNGVGNPAGGIGADQKITNNTFVGHFDANTGEGRYDTVVINGQVAGIGWLLEPTQTPTISGNTFGDNSTPFLLRGSDNSEANLPTAAQIQTILNTNGGANTTYAYVVDSTDGHLITATRNDGAGTYHSFAVTNTIDTLNLALDATPDNVFGGQRDYIHNGDTIIVQSGATGSVDSQIMADNLKVKATANSADLDLTLATTYANGSAIAGGVNNIELLDYAMGNGAAVDVTGNALANQITGNSAANTLDGAGGGDTLKGGGGADTLIGGTGIDTAQYNGNLVPVAGPAHTNFSLNGGNWDVAAGAGEGTDHLSGIEVVTDGSGHTFRIVGAGSEYATTQQAFAASNPGDIIIDGSADFDNNLSLTVDDTADDVINHSEVTTVSFTIAGLDPDASGTVTFSDAHGHHVTSSTITANGSYSIDLHTLDDGPVTSVFNVTDSAGYTTSASGNTVTLDTSADAAPLATVTIDDVDGYINNSEKTTVSYTVTGVDGDATATITFTSSGGGTPVVVSGASNGSTTVNLSALPDGTITASIEIEDDADNTATGTGDSSIKDTTADGGTLASVTFNDGDGFVNASEAPSASYTIAGVDADATATVTFSDGVPAHDIVLSGVTNGTTTVNLSGLNDGPITVSISVTDAALNSANGSGDSSVKDTVIDAAPAASVTFNDGDGFINNSEKATVSYTVAGVDGDATAILTFSDGVPAHDIVLSGVTNGTTTVNLTGLNDGPVTVSVSVTDGAQNTTGGTGDSSVKDTTADAAPLASVTVNDGDGYINLSERSSVSYTVAGVDMDATATVTFSSSGGGTPVVVSGLADGPQSVNLSSLPDGTITASISVSDPALNSANGAGDTSILDATPPSAPSLSTLILGDNGSGGTALDLSGGADTATTIQITGTGGGAPFTSGGAWSQSVDPLAVGSHHIVVTAHDAADNTTSTSFDVNLVDATHVTIDLSGVGHSVSLVDTTTLASGTDVTVTGSSTGGDGIATGDGDDHITTHGASMALAGDGADILNGASDEAFYGEAGSDTITFSGSGSAANYYGLYDPTAGSTDRDYTLEHTATDTWVVTALAGAADLGTDTVTGADSLGFEGSGTALATADLISLLDTASGSVSEGAVNGNTVAVTAHAAGSNVTYSLDNDAGGRFAINAASGVVTVANAALLDFESATSHNINIRATADDGSFTRLTVSIAVTNVAPNQPVDNNGGANTVSEGVVGGEAVGVTAFSTDVHGGTVTYSLTDSAGGRFTIDSSTGVVTVANAALVDYESAVGHSYTITAQASDGTGFSATQDFVITVTNVAPNQPADNDNGTNTVSEGVTGGEAVGVTALSTDVHGGAVTYSLTNTAGGRFAIDSSTGVVTVANAALIDYESSGLSHSYTITVQASDGTDASATQDFVIAVSNVAPNQPADNDNGANTVSEGVTGGEAVGVTAFSTDVHGGTVTYSLTNSAGGRFAIDSSTGVVTVANAALIDYESSGLSHSYTITVQASDGTDVSATQDFVIAVTNVAPNQPADNNGAANTVSEGVTGGEAVGVTALSTDIHGGAVTYSLTNSAGGRFAIDSSTGVVTVANAALVDYESSGPSHSYTITVQATDGTDVSTTQDFVIAVTNVAPNQPADNDNGANTVSEGVTGGETVGVTALSADVHGGTVTYSLTNSAGGRFAIDSSTGIVTVANASLIDYESSGPSHSYTITVQATDGTDVSTTQDFVIDVSNLVPNQPVDNNAGANTVSEGVTGGETVGVTAFSTDVHGGTVTYSLTDSAGGRFTIDSSTGVVTVANAALIDYESAAGHSYTITAHASDGTGFSSTQDFVIAVSNVAPNQPADNNGAANTVSEGVVGGETVGVTALSTDVHGGTVTYSLTNSAGGRFAIDANTGVVTVANATLVDYESSGVSHSYTITVQASDGTDVSTTQDFVIAVTNVAPTQPADNDTVLADSVNENAANGTYVGLTAHSTDVHGGTVTYSLTDSHGGLFAIDSSTGEVTVANSASLDRETLGASVNITVQASDGTDVSSQTFAIAIGDLNDNAPVIQTNTAVHFHVNENAAGGASVGSVSATDGDATSPNNQVSYAITGGTGAALFDINSTTGAITVHTGAMLNFEGTASYTVQVTASDGGSPQLSDIDTFTIDLNNVNEAPVVTAGQTFSPNENIQFVGNVVATDEDSVASGFHSIVYSLVSGASDNSLFTIDPTTGALNFVSAAGSDGADPLGEHGPNYVVDVKVTDGSNPLLTTHQTVAVNAQSIGSITNNGTTGNDTEYGTLSADTLNGNAGNDTIYGGASGDNIDGGSGNDTLYGGVGTDTILGGAGNDKLYGGAGADMLTGGSGADRFHFNAPNEGIDTITDFLSANSVLADKIALDRAGFGIGLSTTTADLFNNGALAFHDGGLWWKGADASLPEVELAIVQHVATLTGNDILLV